MMICLYCGNNTGSHSSVMVPMPSANLVLRIMARQPAV
jgi:hypothetical protein